MSSNPDFDRWYAARQVKFILSPSHPLETFGNTLVNYHLVSELPDYPGKVRVREGRLEAHPPLVITPTAANLTEFLRRHDVSLAILKYGYHLKSDNFSEQILTESLATVTERVKAAVVASGDRFAAVMQGEDEPWDVALVELWRREVDKSARTNISELKAKGKLF